MLTFSHMYCFITGMGGLGWFGTGTLAGIGSTVGWMISSICNVTVKVEGSP